MSTNNAPNLTFGVTVRNLGPDAATNVTMSDVLLAGTTLITATADASEDDPNPGNNSGSAVASAPAVPAIPTASTWGLLALMAIVRMR